jgi:hypothetical protein
MSDALMAKPQFKVGTLELTTVVGAQKARALVGRKLSDELTYAGPLVCISTLQW